MSNPEVVKDTESNVETQRAAAERSQELQNSPENAVEQSPDRHVEREMARQEAKEVFAGEAGKEKKQAADSSAPRAVNRVTKDAKDIAYKQVMQRVRTQMSAPARTFSKIIHFPVVEKASEIVGGTLARPDAILAGSTTALVLVISVYVLARTFGYQLSGFETIGAFILGWLVGLIYDYVRVMALGRRT